jgi:hypothetical protein
VSGAGSSNVGVELHMMSLYSISEDGERVCASTLVTRWLGGAAEFGAGFPLGPTALVAASIANIPA